MPELGSRDEFREETAHLLVRRLRSGFGLVLFSVTAFATADVLSGRAGNHLLHVVQLSQLLVAGVALITVRGPNGAGRAGAVALPVVCFLYVSTAVAAVITGDTETMSLLFIVIAMGTATLLPWGLRSQLVTVLVGAASGMFAFVVAGGGLTVELGYAAIAMIVAMVTSVAAADQIDRHRRALLERNLALNEAQKLARVGSWEWQIPRNRVTWSPELYRIFGRTAEEFPATYEGYLAYVHPEDRAGVERTIAAALVDRRPFEFEHRIVRADGTLRTVHAMGEVVVGPGGEAMRMFGTAQDVTERKEVEQAVARARDSALEASALKSAFLANVSHEIRTPLNIIVGYNEFIAEGLEEIGDRRLSEFNEGIQRACERLLATIQSILDFSRVEAGAFEIRAVPIPLGRSIGEIVKDMRPLAAQKGLALFFEDETPEAVVRFDEYCLSNALLNLLQNAVKFTDEGEISVRLRRCADQLRLEVRDTGIGISPDFLPRLFEPFVQEDWGYTRRFEGSGLGLALAKRYLELNGASIEVESEKGRGSVFIIRFAEECTAAAATATPPRRTAAGGRAL